MSYDVMTADEARALLATLDAERRRCSECGTADAPADGDGRHVGCPSPVGGTVGAWRTCLGPEESARALRAVVEMHERAARRERLTAFWMRGAYAFGYDAAKRGAVAALREWPDAREAVIAAPEPEWPTTGDPLPGVRVPPHGAVVYADDGLPPHIAARLAGVEGVGDAVLVVEYRDPDAPGAGPAEWDSRRAAKRLTAGYDVTWCGIDGTGLVVVHGPQEAYQRPRASPDGGGEPRGDGAPARGR